MARRTPLLLTAALGLAAALPACKDTPSFSLRWQMSEPSDLSEPIPQLQGVAITTAYQCSRFGVTAVRVRTYDLDGFTTSEDVYPCFALGFEDGARQVEGPQLRSGDYVVVAQGVQRDLQEWTSPKRIADAEIAEIYDPDLVCLIVDEGAFCPPWQLACDCATFTAVDDETFSDFDAFVLEAPYDCIDGIDNDDDGLLDSEDPGCSGREAAAGDCEDGVDNDDDGTIDILDPGCYSIAEDNDVAVVQFTLTPTLLDENPAGVLRRRRHHDLSRDRRRGG